MNKDTQAIQSLTFRKPERLHHRALVDRLFERGEHLHAFPLRLTYRILTEKELDETFRITPEADIDSVQVMITVPKKKLHHAVDRVLMRRRIREAWRLRRLPLKALAEQNRNIRTLSVAIVYLADRKKDYGRISEKMNVLLNELSEKIRDYGKDDD